MKRMTKILDSKIFWMIVSFLVSFSVWVYVTSVENVTATKRFQNVPIEIVGKERLEMNNLVITDLDTPTVTVDIRGPRRIVNAMDSTDLTAQVDVSKLSQPTYTTLNYTLVYPSGVDTRNLTVVRKSQESVSFWVSRMSTTTVPVGGEFLGTINGMPDTPIYMPDSVTVSGPEIYLRDVDHAYVACGSSDMVLTSSYTEERSVVLMDKSNKPCENTEYLTITPDTVRATFPVLTQKEIPLTVSLQFGKGEGLGAGANEENTRVIIDPPILKLAGDSAVLDGLNQIQLDVIDVTTFESSYTNKYTITLPDGVHNLSNISEAEVTVEIMGLETKTVEVSNYIWQGVDEDVEVIVETEKFPVILRGPSSLMSRVTTYNVRATADLSEYMGSMGSYFVPVKITVPAVRGVGPIYINGSTEYKVAIRLEKKEGSP